MIKQIKTKFWFYKKTGNILFFKRHSNFFLVLLDSKKRHVVTITSGLCKLGKTKKLKLAPLNMFGLIQKLKIYLELYKIKYLKLYIRQKIPFFFNKLKKLFKFYNLFVGAFFYKLSRAHSKRRGRKPRRI